MKFNLNYREEVLIRLIQDCADFYPIFDRFPTFKEIETWAEDRHIEIVHSTYRSIINKARGIINEASIIF